MRILGIESSCDETGVAVVDDGRLVRSNVIASQAALHVEYGGGVPEIASRAHVERILPALRRSLDEADATLDSIDAVAVGHRPGLIGALLVGVSAAKAMAWSLGRPIVGVDHIEAHLYAGLLDDETWTRESIFPAVGLVVSGGHSTLYRADGPLALERLGWTIDDAVGEAYDKVASILGLSYPGGPVVDRRATSGDDRAYDLPVSRLAPDSLDFSFSGLKTAVLYAVRGTPRRGGAGQIEHPRDPADLSEREIDDLCASFQRAAVAALLLKLRRAIETMSPAPRTILLGGGVSANSRLRAEVTALGATLGIPVRLPPLPYCLDNAAMIAGLAFERGRADDVDDLELAAVPSGAG